MDRKNQRQKLNEFKELSRPIIKFLNENFDPHYVAIIASDRADIFGEEMGFPCNDYEQE